METIPTPWLIGLIVVALLLWALHISHPRADK